LAQSLFSFLLLVCSGSPTEPVGTDSWLPRPFYSYTIPYFCKQMLCFACFMLLLKVCVHSPKHSLPKHCFTIPWVVLGMGIAVAFMSFSNVMNASSTFLSLYFLHGGWDIFTCLH
jgi:hypothetical protein